MMKFALVFHELWSLPPGPAARAGRPVELTAAIGWSATKWPAASNAIPGDKTVPTSRSSGRPSFPSASSKQFPRSIAERRSRLHSIAIVPMP